MFFLVSMLVILLLDLGSGTENVRRLNVQGFTSNLAGLSLKTHLNTVSNSTESSEWNVFMIGQVKFSN